MAKKHTTANQGTPLDTYTLPKSTLTSLVVDTPPRGGDAGIPEQPTTPVVETMGKTLTAASAPDDYSSINDQIWGEGGTGEAGYEQIVDAMNRSGGAVNALTDKELFEFYEQFGVDPELMYEHSNKGGYTQNLETALAGGGTGEPAEFDRDGIWYYYDGKPREMKDGTAGADEWFLSDGNYQLVQYCQEEYEKAETPEDKAYWHNIAEKIRARSGYSGGTDGSMYIPVGALSGERENISGGNSVGAVTSASPEDRMNALLDAWQSAALEQNNAAVDYAVQQAIAEYERMLQDAQPQFKAQAESVALEEQQALDNAALYAEMRGDRGGIGQAQYGSIMNAAAQNRLAVQQAQTKLATDTAREIADLRAQGEFEKADTALEITQEYLTKLMEIERWAAEYQLSQEQFAAQMQRWEAEYMMEWKQLQLSQDRWQQEFDYEKYMESLKLGSSGTEAESVDAAEIYRLVFEAGFTDADRGAVKAYLMAQGIDSELADALARAYANEVYISLRYGEPDSFGSGWSAEEWAKIMEAAEINLKRGLPNAFDEHNMREITSKISREQWVELCRLMERYNFSLEDEQ